MKNMSEEEKAKIIGNAFADGLRGNNYSDNAMMANIIGEYEVSERRFNESQEKMNNQEYQNMSKQIQNVINPDN